MSRKYGLIPKRRGFFKAYQLPQGYDLQVVPDIDLRPQMAQAGISHKDQGHYGACVFYSGSVLMSYLHWLDHSDQPAPDLGPCAPYEEVREYYRTMGQITSLNDDCGSSGDDAFKIFQSNGIPTEKTWPFTDTNFAVSPSDNARTEALNFKALEGFDIPANSITISRAALHIEQKPLWVGIAVPPEMESQQVAQTGIMDDIVDYTLQNILGYHQVLVVASETIEGRLYFWIWNSWGEDWGCKGNMRVPASLFAKLCMSAQVIRKAS